MEDENNDIIRWREWLEMELPYMYNQWGNFRYNLQMLNPNQARGGNLPEATMSASHWKVKPSGVITIPSAGKKHQSSRN